MSRDIGTYLTFMSSGKRLEFKNLAGGMFQPFLMRVDLCL